MSKIINYYKSSRFSDFTIDATNCSKGVALLILLFHHVGIMAELQAFPPTSRAYNIALMGKVCVSIFVLLSGYGVASSYIKNSCKTLNDHINYVTYRFRKLYLFFWPVFVLFLIFGVVSGFRSFDIYEPNIILNLITDFFGFSDLFATPTYNKTWWFITLILLLYFASPIFLFICKKFSQFFCILIIIFVIFAISGWTLGVYPLFIYYAVPFMLGIFLKFSNFFKKMYKNNVNIIIQILIAFSILLVAIAFRYKNNFILTDVLLSFSIILFVWYIFGAIKPVKSMFVFLGKHSGNIFLFHGILVRYYFPEFFISLNYWWLMYIVLLCGSLLISVIIESIKSCLVKLYKILIVKRMQAND